MIKVFKVWMERYFSDPEAILLMVFLVCGLLIILTFGSMLAPVFVALAITALLQCWVNFLERYGCPHKVAYWLVYLTFIGLLLLGLFFLTPMIWKQSLNLLAEIPAFIANSKALILEFIQSRGDYISQQYFEALLGNVLSETQMWAKHAVSSTISSIPGVITWVVYLILVPLMVFFFLQDQDKIIAWLKSFLPAKRGIVSKVWHEMIEQIGNYVRGKITEIFVVGFFSYLVFLYFGLNYQLLLACLVGLSVIIPYIGAIVVTIPVVMVAYFQWGFAGGLTGDMAMLTYAYLFVQFLDGNILVPLLFSEAVNLHPVAIIIAILFFGAIWGIWGVFFAIPLATLVKSVINAWPKSALNVERRRRLSRRAT